MARSANLKASAATFPEWGERKRVRFATIFAILRAIDEN